MLKRGLGVFLVLFLVCVVSQASAAETTMSDELGGMGKKLGRGLINVLSSPAEIPCAMSKDMAASPGAGFFTGFGKGTVFMLRRILVGATEAGTFLIPMEATIPPVCKA